VQECIEYLVLVPLRNPFLYTHEDLCRHRWMNAHIPRDLWISRTHYANTRLEQTFQTQPQLKHTVNVSNLNHAAWLSFAVWLSFQTSSTTVTTRLKHKLNHGNHTAQAQTSSTTHLSNQLNHTAKRFKPLPHPPKNFGFNKLKVPVQHALHRV
jgi:hypothetical protein